MLTILLTTNFSLPPNIQYMGQDKPVIAKASGDRVDLLVYPACDQTCKNITDIIYGGSSSSSTVAWTAVSGVEYKLLVTSAVFSSDTPAPIEFELQIFDNDFCENAFGPITLVGVNTDLVGSTSDATVDTQAISCGSASSPTAPGVWYTIIGNGEMITASTCTGFETDFDSQLSVFTGGSCGQLMCVDGNDDACGNQSLVDFQSNQDQTYHVLVHGFGGASGNFGLRITPTRLANIFDVLVSYNVSIQALQDISSPQYEALAWMANNDSPQVQSKLSNDELVERFVIVDLYFATGGASWFEPANILIPYLRTCAWDGSEFDATSVCNEEGSVLRLDLGKFPNSST